MQQNRLGKKEQLIVIAIDFKKAFDSIDRRKLIEIMIEYRINPYIINLIANIYSNETTIISLGEMEKEIEINVGIKQGCTVSTTLFKIITYVIMNSIEEKGVEYEVENLKISSLFFADDGTLLTKTEQDAKKNLDIIIEASLKFGLVINKDKSNILVYNNENITGKIEGIEIVNEIKYLGIQINDDRDIFKNQKKLIVERLKKYKLMTNKVIETSCNRLMLGKLYWKQIIMTKALYGIGLMNINKKEVNEIQKIENETYTMILRAREKTPLAALRGETGSSLVSTRFIQSRIMLIHSILNGKNQFIKKYLRK